ncbi:hypothetical protein GOODEAATRI_015668 [Goodea atripinnis]|uniref:C2 domain-containing protein n=1 Tax=Goodea atripinnis TaxID=208336 RepID=A0ABV0PYA2_9TELE
MTRKIERNQQGRDYKTFMVQLCIGLNNVEHVRVYLAHLPRDLDWPGVERAMEESCGVEGKEQVYKALNGQLLNMDLDLQREAKRLITLLTDKKTLKHTPYGRISVKCYYDPPEQRLTVEILHAADIIALDANGLSDPFVIVELCPHHLFPAAKSQRTQVKLKTLHPVFDELHRYACLTFTVMDYDWLSTNDFAGEAVAPLSDFCWPGRPNASAAGKNVQPIILHLSRSKPNKPIMRMLDARTGDREAQEFVRRLKEIEKSMEED